LKQAYIENLGNSGKDELVKILNLIHEGTSDSTIHEEASKKTINLPSKGRSDQVLTMMWDVIVKLIQVISRFRTEFVGTTLVQTGDNLYTRSKEELEQYLFDPQISEEEADKRFTNLKDEIEKIIIHQVALLDGYNASIQEGVPGLIKELDPAIIDKEVSENYIKLGFIKIPIKLIPFLTKLKTLQLIQNRIYDLSQEDRGVFENKYFRPAFIKRYLENITLAKKSDTSNNEL